MVTIVEIAKRAGVSKSTASAVICNPTATRKASPETRARVLSVARAMGYSPNQAARCLRQGASKIIGLVMHRNNGGMTNVVIDGIDEITHDNSYHLLYCTFDTPEDLQIRLHELSAKRPDGWILVGVQSESHQQVLREFLSTRESNGGVAPGVTVCTPSFIPEVPGCFVPIAEISALAAHTLLEMGHRKILFAATAREGCLETFQQAVEHAGFDFNATVRVLPPCQGIQAAPEVFRAWAEGGRESAIFAYNDVLAAGLLREASRAGVAVPDELSVLGVDGFDFGELLQPTLTTINQSHYEQGRLSATVLLERIAGRNTPLVNYVQPGLLVRNSCAPPKTGTLHPWNP